MEHQPWRAEAKCKELPLDKADKLFHVGRGRTTPEAFNYCLGCPVRMDCLNFAIVNHERAGVWGGLREKERDQISALVLAQLKQQELLEKYREARLPIDSIVQMRDGRHPTSFLLSLESA